MTLNDIRNRSGLLILVIGVAMLGFILTDLMNSGTSLFQKSQNLLLKIDKQEVTFTNFERELEKNINVKFANNFGAVNINEVQRNSERDLLWDQTIEEILFSEKFNQSGLAVGDLESWDLISGEITSNQAEIFRYFFRDQTESGEWNQYNPEMIQSWIEIGADNPQWFRYLFFKDNVIRERAFLKYYNAVKKGLYPTKYDAKSFYADQTKSVGGRYVYLPIASQTDSVEVSEKEIKQYYKKNKSEFKNEPNREVSYFTFSLAASKNDKDDIMNKMVDLISDTKIFNKRTNTEEINAGFETTNNLESFVNQYGDNKYFLTNISREEFDNLVINKTMKNDIIYPYFDKNFCRMGRVVSLKSDSVEVVYLDREIYASDQTLNEIYSEVYDLINNNKQIDDIENFSKENNIRPRNVVLEKMDQSVPGLGVSRQIVRWAFNEETNLNEPKFFDLEDKYIIAVLSNVVEGETKPIFLVEDDIRLILENKKKANLIVNKIKNSGYNTLQDISDNFDVDVSSINGLRMNSDIFGNEGYNPGLVGAFFGSKIGEISDPIILEKGVCVFKKEDDGSINYPSNFIRYQQLINNEYNSKVDLLLVDILKENKNIIDNRFNFY